MRTPFDGRKGRLLLFAVIGSAFAGIAWLDLATPLNIVVWLLYLLPIWLLSRVTPFDARLVRGGAATTTGLIVADFFLAHAGIHTSIAALNRLIGITLVWIVSLLLVRARRQEAALRDNQERLRLALESAELGTWDDDLARRRSVWNERAYLLFGFQPPFPPGGEALWNNAVYPDDRALAAHAVERARLDRTLYRYEHRIVRRDDGAVRWIAPYGRFLYDGSGTAHRFVGVFSDITERKLAEEALERSEAQFRANFELAAVGQAQLNVETGCFIRVNDRFCGIAGYTRGELLGMTPHDLTHPDDRAIDEPQIARLLRGEREEYHCEKRYLRKDGGIRWVLVSARLIRDGAGRPTRTISVVEDITERKEAEASLVRLTMDLEHRVAERTKALTDSEQRLRALTSELNLIEQRERRRLAGELHDYLAQLLVVGRMKLTQALSKMSPDGPQEHLLEADEMLDRSLTYTRSLVAQLAPPVLQQFGLPAALSWLGEEFGRHGLRVVVRTAGEAPPLSADQAGLLFQSARELLMNVVKHARAESALVMLDHDETKLVVTVQDKGIGFEGANSLETVTNKFGLFSIRERMHALGGSCAIDSAPGGGTTATLVLPLLQARGQGREASGEEIDTTVSMRQKTEDGTGILDFSSSKPLALGPSPLASARIRVLLVDDHAMVREGLRSLLSGYRDIDVVGEAADGEDAVDLAGRLQPHVVVMDVNMPKMDGIEATRLITRRHPAVVIGLSVNASRQVQDTMRAAGALTLLTKESAADSLYQTIRSAAIGTIHPADDQEPLPFAE